MDEDPNPHAIVARLKAGIAHLREANDLVALKSQELDEALQAQRRAVIEVEAANDEANAWKRETK